MMQRGVDLSQLDVSYVSSLALYFLLMFGLNDVYSLILGEGSEMDEQRMMQMQMGMGMMGNQAGFDAGAAYRMEKDLLTITTHQWVSDLEEKKLLGDSYPDEHSQPPVDLSKFLNMKKKH
eukprot:CAMPEP_0119035286 /NCGR_PEP_ID=MMETSP1177-20130426/2217_1 /TAXON_ID=2985 /ORGANISM="Ochromonas sp, Strain CCMP1899" /LENGTH=119 /DNA_ID=CAMNT_0006993309 /DNA_START=592 /DNA_END=951 /DNA_ORIENTATION=+